MKCQKKVNSSQWMPNSSRWIQRKMKFDQMGKRLQLNRVTWVWHGSHAFAGNFHSSFDDSRLSVNAYLTKMRDFSLYFLGIAEAVPMRVFHSWTITFPHKSKLLTTSPNSPASNRAIWMQISAVNIWPHWKVHIRNCATWLIRAWFLLDTDWKMIFGNEFFLSI